MKDKKFKIFLIVGIVFVVLCACVVGIMITSNQEPEPIPTVAPTPTATIKPTPTPTIKPTPTKTPYESPIDFDSWQEKNKDIFSWLKIDGTNVDYPIFNRENDNAYYIRRDINGNYSEDGVLFTEDYNTLDFNDPVTLIYGHNLYSGDMFGQLQANYTDPDSFKENNEVTVYLKDKTLTYQIFAAVPFDNRHILYYHDFENPDVFDRFIEEIQNIRSFNMIYDKEVEVKNDDKLIILSTCLSNFDSSKRFLVLAVQTDVIE